MNELIQLARKQTILISTSILIFIFFTPNCTAQQSPSRHWKFVEKEPLKYWEKPFKLFGIRTKFKYEVESKSSDFDFNRADQCISWIISHQQEMEDQSRILIKKERGITHGKFSKDVRRIYAGSEGDSEVDVQLDFNGQYITYFEIIDNKITRAEFYMRGNY